jgi:hypothetical protein
MNSVSRKPFFGQLCTLAAISAVWACAALPVAAQTELEGSVREESLDSSRPRGVDGVEYGGVVTRAIVSSLGELFYRRFAEAWSTQKDTANFVLTVRESNSRRGNTEVLVVYLDDVLFRAFLPRNQQAVISLSEAAADVVYQKIVEIGLQELLNDNPDMARLAL